MFLNVAQIPVLYYPEGCVSYIDNDIPITDVCPQDSFRMNEWND